MNLYLCILLLVSLGIPSGFTYTVYIDRNFGTKQYCYEGYEQQFCLNNYYGFQTGEAKTFCNRMCNIDKYNKSPPVYAFQIINKLGLTMQANLAADTDPYSFVTIEFTYFGSYPLQIDLMQTTLQALLFTPILPRPPTGYIVPSTDASYYVFSVLQSYPQYNPTVADSTFDVSDILSVFCSSEFFQIKAASINILKSDFNDIFLQQALIIQLSSPNSFQAVSLRSIRISKNCVANCLTCLDDTNCLTCMSGMTTYTFSSGIVGCVQSGLACSALANCFTCAISDTESACFSCYPGFNFNLGICAASKQTPSTPCTNHQYNLNGVCYTYSSIGYYEDRVDSNFNPITSLTAFQIQKTYKCPQGTLVIAYKQNNYSNYVCKCFFDLCISCSTISTCDLCASGYAFDESTNLCQPINLTSNPFTFSQEVTSTGYLFKIVFSKGILYSQLTNNDFKVVISDIIDYTYNFDGFKNGDTIEISVTCREMVKGKTATITFTNLIFVSGNLMATSTILVDLEGFMNLSQSILQISSDVKFLSNLVATFIVCLLIPIAFLGFFGMIMYTTDIIAFLYYDLFIAVRFPINVVNFAQGFKILQLDFVINFFGTLLNSNTFQSSRIQWMKQPTDGYFLASTGQMISVFLVIIILYLFTKMISKMDFPHISDIFKRAVIQTWEFSALLYAVWFVYIYILMGVLMYLFDPSCKSSTSCSLNKTLFALSFIIVALFPIFVAYLIRYMNEQRFEKYLAMKLAALISGIRLFTQKDLLLPKQQNKYFLEEDPTKQQVLNQAQIEQIRFASSLEMQMMGRRDKIIFVLTKYTVLVLYLRKMIFSLIICFLNSSPNIQIIFISLINLFMAMFFTFLKPYQSRYENIKQTLSELFMILYQIFILILVSDPADQKEENRILIGWGVILIASLIIIWHTISIVVLFWQAARVIYAQWKLNKEQGKIIPQESLFNQNIFDNSASSSSEAIQIFERNNKRTNTLSQVSNMFMPHKLGETEQDKKSPRKKQESEIVSGVLDLNRNESKVRPSLYTPTVTASPESFLPLRLSKLSVFQLQVRNNKDIFLKCYSITFFL